MLFWAGLPVVWFSAAQMKHDHDKKCIRTLHLCIQFYEFLSSDPEILREQIQLMTNAKHLCFWPQVSLLCRFLKNRKHLIIKGYLCFFSNHKTHHRGCQLYPSFIVGPFFNSALDNIQRMTFQGLHIKLKGLWDHSFHKKTWLAFYRTNLLPEKINWW